ncbi:MAG: PQQ-binding-like beta-propeller repeat protein, partial [Acidobacteriota bacterium]
MRIAALALAASIGLFAADAPWPQFRGPGSNGIGEGAGLPAKWSATENIRWRVPVPGVGWSSPVVAGGRVFLTAAISNGDIEPPKKGLYFGGNRGKTSDVHRWMVYAFDFESGKLAWEREVRRGAPPIARHLKNSFASETPVTDGERVYAWFGSAGLFCFDLQGKLLWSKDSPGLEMRYGWGTAASPVLHGGRIYIVHDNDSASYLMALDKVTGREIWRVARDDEKSNWSTPFIWTHDG